MGNFHSVSSVGNTREAVKIEKYSTSKPVSPVSQNSRPTSQNSKPTSQNSKPTSLITQLESSGLENGKPMSQTAQLEDPWLENSKPMSQTLSGSSEDDFLWSEIGNFPWSEIGEFPWFEGDDVQPFEGNNQQDTKGGGSCDWLRCCAASGSKAGGGTKPGAAVWRWVKIKMKNLSGVTDVGE
ncbi:hypothetical protein Ancab_023685 [Ancistrocladus abbreviatus]